MTNEQELLTEKESRRESIADYEPELPEAWITVALEFRKQVLTLSSAGVGLLVVVVRDTDEGLQRMTSSASLVCFSISAVISLCILSLGAKLIRDIHKRRKTTEVIWRGAIRFFEVFAVGAFGLGIIFAAWYGLLAVGI